jgi:hypothetical protein
MGFPKIAPLPFKVCCVLSKRVSRRRCALGERLPSLKRGPSSSFLTTSTVCSATHLQVYCTLLPAMGFATFPDVIDNAHQRKRWFVFLNPPFPSGA